MPRPRVGDRRESPEHLLPHLRRSGGLPPQPALARGARCCLPCGEGAGLGKEAASAHVGCAAEGALARGVDRGAPADEGSSAGRGRRVGACARGRDAFPGEVLPVGDHFLRQALAAETARALCGEILNARGRCAGQQVL